MEYNLLYMYYTFQIRRDISRKYDTDIKSQAAHK